MLIKCLFPCSIIQLTNAHFLCRTHFLLSIFCHANPLHAHISRASGYRMKGKIADTITTNSREDCASTWKKVDEKWMKPMNPTNTYLRKNETKNTGKTDEKLERKKKVDQKFGFYCFGDFCCWLIWFRRRFSFSLKDLIVKGIESNTSINEEWRITLYKYKIKKDHVENANTNST